MGIQNSSLPADIKEIIELRKLLTSLEDATQAKLGPTEMRGLTVTTIWIPARDGHKIRCLMYKPTGDGPFPVYV
jgi:predicted acyl esterase